MERVDPEQENEQDSKPTFETDSTYLLNVDEVNTDVRRFFIKFQTGFEGEIVDQSSSSNNE